MLSLDFYKQTSFIFAPFKVLLSQHVCTPESVSAVCLTWKITTYE